MYEGEIDLSSPNNSQKNTTFGRTLYFPNTRSKHLGFAGYKKDGKECGIGKLFFKDFKPPKWVVDGNRDLFLLESN